MDFLDAAGPGVDLAGVDFFEAGIDDVAASSDSFLFLSSFDFLDGVPDVEGAEEVAARFLTYSFGCLRAM